MNWILLCLAPHELKPNCAHEWRIDLAYCSYAGPGCTVQRGAQVVKPAKRRNVKKSCWPSMLRSKNVFISQILS